jgi:ATP-dependent helicase HrpB
MARRSRKLPLPARLAHMVIVSGARRGKRMLAARIAMVLTEPGLGGIVQRICAGRFARSKANAVSAPMGARKLADRIARCVAGDCSALTLNEDRAGRILAIAYPDRVAKARAGGLSLALMGVRN